jgi:hypothetical protein
VPWSWGSPWVRSPPRVDHLHNFSDRPAPAGDKVVAAGCLGSRLVAALLVDKYDDGLPLHRQKQVLDVRHLNIADKRRRGNTYKAAKLAGTQAGT